MKQYAVGLIGYGGFGGFLHEVWSDLDCVEVVAVADENPARAPGGVRAHEDWRHLVSDEQIDIVAIATPPVTHVQLACAALSSRKHVLVEKPVATTLEDARRILEVRDRSGCLATVDFMLRFNPIVESIREWCRSGCFGNLRRVAVENYAQDESLEPEHWFWDQVLSGGIFVEHAVHFFDIVQWCSGSNPKHVDGVAVRRNPRQEDRVMATVVHDDGLVATHYHSFSGPDFFEQTSMRFVFDLLRLEVMGWIPMSGRVNAMVTRENEEELRRLPGFRVLSLLSADEIEFKNDSRKTGRQDVDVRVAGQPHTIVGAVEGEFALPVTKSEAYAMALRELMLDFVKAIDDAGHRHRVTLEDGIASLEIALRAAENVRR